MSRMDENPYRPCPCGSAEKYKFCCLEKDRDKLRKAPAALSSLLLGYDQPPDDLVDAAEEAHRRGTELVGRLRGREAIPYIEKAIRLFPQVPNPHNNLAIAHFIEGDVEKALEVAERVDRDIDPGNVFALGQQVHYLILLGRRDEAKRTGDRLLGLQCRDESAFVKKCEAFARLGRHADVHATALAGLPSSRAERSGLAFFAGVSAANLERYGEAERHLVQAVDDPVHGRTAASNLDRLRKKRGPGTLSGEWPYLEWGFWMLPSLYKRLKTPADARRYPGIVETVASVLDDRLEDEAVLKVLGYVGTPEAIDLLRKVAFGTFGTDSMRRKALLFLQECGAVANGEEVKMWLGGEWRDLKPVRQELTIEAAIPLHEDLLPMMTEMVACLNSGMWIKAERLGRKLVQRAPDSPQAIHNLAMALRHQKKLDEAERLLRRVMATDPGYLYAPAALAMIKLEQGKAEEAKSVLQSAELRDKVDPGGYVIYLLAQAELAVQEHDYDAAARTWRAAEELAPDHPGVIESRSNLARRLSEWSADSYGRIRERREKKRRRLLSAGPTPEEVWADATANELREMAQRFMLPRLSGLKKEALRSRVLEAFQDQDRIRMLVLSLAPDERETLGQLVRGKEPVSYEEYLKPASRPLTEKRSPSWTHPVDRLAQLGLVAIGVVGKQVAIVIPPILRPTIHEALGS